VSKAIRPTGIIRTLPSLYMDDKNVGHRKYRRSVAALESGYIDAIYIALAAVPKVEVLHIYLLIEGQIQVRLNIAGYEPGDARACWDNTIRRPKVWAVCTGPVSRPPEQVNPRRCEQRRFSAV
jgi:hypothetical protein